MRHDTTLAYLSYKMGPHEVHTLSYAGLTGKSKGAQKGAAAKNKKKQLLKK